MKLRSRKRPQTKKPPKQISKRRTSAHPPQKRRVSLSKRGRKSRKDSESEASSSTQSEDTSCENETDTERDIEDGGFLEKKEVSEDVDMTKNDEWQCGVCAREVRYQDEGILCEAGCNQWYHRECVKLTKLAFELLQGEERAQWACDTCVATRRVRRTRKLSVPS